MKKYLLLVALTLLLIIPSKSLAASLAPVDRLDIDTALRTDGSIDVFQVIVFSTVTTLDWRIYSNIENLSVSADGVDVTKNVTVSRDGDFKKITSYQTAKNWLVSYNASSLLVRHNQLDQLYFKVFEAPGRAVNNVKLKFRLPESATIGELHGNIYAISGVSTPRILPTDINQLSYQIDGATASSILTLNASWPKNIVSLSLYQEIRLYLQNMEGLPYLVVGMLIPIIALIMLGMIITRQLRDETDVKNRSNKPPSNLSPLVAGVIINKKIYPYEIVAMIIDLCQRGYLVIVKKNAEYHLAIKRPFDDKVEKWEVSLVNQLFKFTDNAVTIDQTKKSSRRVFYSSSVHMAFSEVYQNITDMDIFVENPHKTRVKYKLVALGFYYLSLASLIYIALTNTSPYFIIPLIGTMFVSAVIIRMTPQLVYYTPNGITSRFAWLSFANYLKSNDPLTLADSQSRIFEQYLAYGVAFGVAYEWSQRFRKSTIVKPEWMITYTDNSTYQLIEEIVTFTDSLAKYISNLKGPLVV